MKNVLTTGLFCALIGYSTFAQLTAIKAGKFIDPKSGNVLLNQIILVEGTKIKSVGANLSIPRGATVIDLSKYTVLPGLIDCHTHVMLQPQDEGEVPPVITKSPLWCDKSLDSAVLYCPR
jgi:imidazolonepropionase-like amidohydrolase